VSFFDAAGTRVGYVGDGSTGDKNVFLASDEGVVALSTPAGRVLTATSTGNVGIGTTTPQAKLDIMGDVKLGSNGQLFATGGEENLRIIRGSSGPSGNIYAGASFTVTHFSEGKYRVIFNTPFTARPVVIGSDRSFMTEVTVHGFILETLAFGNLADLGFSFIAIGPR
jgi:hypothetical protein